MRDPSLGRDSSIFFLLQVCQLTTDPTAIRPRLEGICEITKGGAANHIAGPEQQVKQLFSFGMHTGGDKPIRARGPYLKIVHMHDFYVRPIKRWLDQRA